MYVVEGPVCNNVPPTARLYHLNCGDPKPEVEVTLAFGIPLPHCSSPLLPEGAVGMAFTVTVTFCVLVQVVAGS